MNNFNRSVEAKVIRNWRMVDELLRKRFCDSSYNQVDKLIWTPVRRQSWILVGLQVRDEIKKKITGT